MAEKKIRYSHDFSDKIFKFMTLNSRYKMHFRGHHKKMRLKNILSSWELHLPEFCNTCICNGEHRDYVPQGLCKIEDVWLISAYDSNHKNPEKSVIYVCDEKMQVKYIWQLPFIAHVGGIAFDGELLWVCAGANKMCGFDYDMCISMSKVGAVVDIDAAQRDAFEADSRTSFCAYYDKMIWTGTFSYPPEFDGPALAYGYKKECNRNANDDNNSIWNMKKRLNIPERIQGMCFFKYNNCEYLALSQSGSTLFVYSNEDDFKTPVVSIRLPRMLEQIIYEDGKLYLLFESSAGVYAKFYRKLVSRICEIDVQIFLNR